MTGRPCECGHVKVLHRLSIAECVAVVYDGFGAATCECQRYTAPAMAEVEARGTSRLPGMEES